jgi:hypothetical protein
LKSSKVPTEWRKKSLKTWYLQRSDDYIWQNEFWWWRSIWKDLRRGEKKYFKRDWIKEIEISFTIHRL